MNTLNQFYNDEHTREDVKAFLLEQLDKMALKRVYAGQDVNGIADARQAIEQSFIELREMFEKKKESSVINQAR